MLEARIEMVLGSQIHNVLEMGMVNMRIHSEKSFEYHLNDIQKVLRERHSQLTRKQVLIIQLVLHPGHQEVNIFAS